MALFDFLNRKRPALDGASDEGVSPVASDLTANEAVRRKQRLLLAGVAGAGLILSSFWIFSGDEKGDKLADDGTSEVTVSTKDLVNRNLSQQEWMALSENRFQSTENQLKSIDGQNRRLEMLTAQVEALKGQNQAMQADGQRVLSAYQAENEQLRRQINARPVLAILDGLPSEEVSRLAVEIIRENRRRVDLAQSLFEKLEEPETADSSHHGLEDLRREYHVALLELKIHHELVRLVVDVLGYVPDVPEDRSTQ